MKENRRQFLKNVITATGGIAFGSGLLTCVQQSVPKVLFSSFLEKQEIEDHFDFCNTFVKQTFYFKFEKFENIDGNTIFEVMQKEFEKHKMVHPPGSVLTSSNYCVSPDKTVISGYLRYAMINV
ncbi:twin-arginine translocation signal domain-containing protein [Candidatus Parcubacteria bacterium]|nr:MAG: twin-arginine translocation signal domain-containing protein [Candidatus Parcubacteria bacterium]